MKKFYLLLTFVSLLGLVLLTGYGAGPATAAMNLFIGAPGYSATTCGTCHGSPGNFGIITTDIKVYNAGTTTPPAAYVPGTSYDVVVEVLHPIGTPSRFGFQCVAFDSGNLQAGTFLNPQAGVSVVVLPSGVEVAEHSSFLTSPTFTFQWTAPNAFTGPVTFWAGGVAANGNGQNTGDGGSPTPTSFTLVPDKVVPIELAEFTGRQTNQSVVLEWITQSEVENSHFIIEYADESLEFVQIGQVNGSGTTTTTQHYRFVHENPTFGANQYYRLKQVDFDGKFSYTKIVSVYMEGNIEQISVFPTPATTDVTVLVNIKNSDSYTLTITDLNGKVIHNDVFNLFAGEQSLQLDIANWPSGHYIYRLTNKRDQMTTSIVKF